MERIHATCIALNGVAILLRGPSGSGKSDLALRLIDQGWDLVADDYTELTAIGETLIATAPQALSGVLEVRGLGLIKIKPLAQAQVHAIFDLIALDDIERLPGHTTTILDGLTLTRFALYGLEPSAPAKIRLALKTSVEDYL